ncbi:MAG: hypothetical protein FWH18_12820 [Marinilabiliaceae bacterium]|nr:hypothetical protein [Marinilabiliaceae bacterium]
MGVDLIIVGKHSIPFKSKEIESKSQIVGLLNSLKFEESEFLIESRKIWNSAHLHSDWGEEFQRKNEEELARCLKIRSWQFYSHDRYDYEDDDYCPHTRHYFLEGPYGLELGINKFFFEIDIWVNRYHHWFKANDDYNVLWREKWRQVVYKVTSILGGDYVMYFPDSSYKLSGYLPCQWFFTDVMQEYLQTPNIGLDKYVEIISERYAKPITLAKADKIFAYDLEKTPFIVDRFEDLDKTLKI